MNRTDVNEAAHARLQTRGNHSARAELVGAPHLAGPIARNRDHGGQVKRELGAVERPAQRGGVEQIALHTANGQPFDGPNVVANESGDVVPIFYEGADEIGSDEARGSGEGNAHGRMLRHGRR